MLPWEVEHPSSLGPGSSFLLLSPSGLRIPCPGLCCHSGLWWGSQRTGIWGSWAGGSPGTKCGWKCTVLRLQGARPRVGQYQPWCHSLHSVLRHPQVIPEDPKHKPCFQLQCGPSHAPYPGFSLRPSLSLVSKSAAQSAHVRWVWTGLDTS